MISLTKSNKSPSSLRRGIARTAQDCLDYDADPHGYRSGVSDFDITSKIYGTDVVKRTLKTDQHGKCAFCEAIFDANVAGDVEHYRPKGAIDTAAGRVKPGYYWLGYVWSNLSYACPDCNGYRKRARFPLRQEAARALDHHGDLAAEAPLLLDPYGAENPRDHIVFRGEAPEGLTDEGSETIAVLGLDRTALARDRLQRLRDLRLMWNAAQLLETDPRPEAAEQARLFRAELQAAVAPTAKFSAAADDYLRALEAGTDYLPPDP